MTRCDNNTSSCCRAALDGPSASALAQRFAALSDPVRLRMLAILANDPSGSVSAGDLASCVRRSQPTISHHLHVLFNAGLLQRQRDGKHVIYRIDQRALSELLAPAQLLDSGSAG